MQVRPAEPRDLEACGALDHSYSTDRVWQMETRRETAALTIAFREARLPREVDISYPRQGDDLLAGWWRRDAFLVAEEGERVCGYVALSAQPEHGLAWVGDLIVDRPLRRRRIGTALFKAAAKWGRAHDLVRITVELQTRNYPAIKFCQSCGLTFSGYNDHYWPSQDIAVFFSGPLR